jgi:hypothetical protein
VNGDHPTWCTRHEPVGEQHASELERVAGAEDVIDVRLRVTQPAALTGDCSPLTMMEFIFIEGGMMRRVALGLLQTVRLADAIDNVLFAKNHLAVPSGSRMEELRRGELLRPWPVPRSGRRRSRDVPPPAEQR